MGGIGALRADIQHARRRTRVARVRSGASRAHSARPQALRADNQHAAAGVLSHDFSCIWAVYGVFGLQPLVGQGHHGRRLERQLAKATIIL